MICYNKYVGSVDCRLFSFLFTKNTGENKFSKMKKHLKIFIAFVIIVSVSVASFFV